MLFLSQQDMTAECGHTNDIGLFCLQMLHEHMKKRLYYPTIYLFKHDEIV